MRLIPLDLYWAIEPSYFDKVLRFPLAEVANGMRLLQAAYPVEQRELDDYALPMQVKGSVAVIRIEGVITKNPSIFSMLFGGTSSVLIRRSIEQAAADPDVKTAVLIVDSPGGSVDGAAETADAIWAARDSIQIIAQVSGMAASLAYLYASQAHKILAGRMDMVGSIGTVAVLYDFSAMFEKEGIRAVPVTTGPFKAAGAMGTEITEEQEADFQRIVDQYFGDFKAMVQRGRRMAAKRVDEVADGRMFMAETEAKPLGLIDGISDADTTLRDLATKEKRARRVRQVGTDLALADAEM